MILVCLYGSENKCEITTTDGFSKEKFEMMLCFMKIWKKNSLIDCRGRPAEECHNYDIQLSWPDSWGLQCVSSGTA
jgi:hypothetical protein